MAICKYSDTLKVSALTLIFVSSFFFCLPKRKTKQKEKGTGATPPLDPASSFGAEKGFVIIVPCRKFSLSAETPSGRLGGRAPVRGGASDRDVVDM